MIFGGSLAVLTGTVLACKATTKVDEVLKKREAEKQKIDNLHEGILVLENGAPYTEEMYKKNLLKVKALTAGDLAKLYLPSAVCTFGGLGMILGGHHMMRKEIAATAAVSAAIKQSFDDYRSRVSQKLGEEEEQKLYLGLEEREETVVEVNEKGKEKTKTTKYLAGPGMPSIYARYFDQTNPNWRGREDYDFVFLKKLQNDLNDMFYINYGYLMLNTALYEGGWPMTKLGQTAGWINRSDGTSDNFVDLGIFDQNGKPKQWALDMYRREGRILVDFNVDGDIIHEVPLDDI